MNALTAPLAAAARLHHHGQAQQPQRLAVQRSCSSSSSSSSSSKAHTSWAIRTPSTPQTFVTPTKATTHSTHSTTHTPKHSSPHSTTQVSSTDISPTDNSQGQSSPPPPIRRRHLMLAAAAAASGAGVATEASAAAMAAALGSAEEVLLMSPEVAAVGGLRGYDSRRGWLVASVDNGVGDGILVEGSEEEEATVALFEGATSSVVAILNVQTTQSKGRGGGGGEEKVEGIGSGFIWDKYGHIVTNYHVVAKLATDSSGKQMTRVTILAPGGTIQTLAAQLVGIDASRDLAVIKVVADNSLPLTPLPIGSSADLRVGQNCFAIGNPFGYEHTLTAGVISGLNREIPAPTGAAIPGAIQTDAAINSGNSGGPLLDSFGRIIGVNTATFTRAGSGVSSGVNFAIPIDTVRRVVPRLIVYGTSRPAQV